MPGAASSRSKNSRICRGIVFAGFLSMSASSGRAAAAAIPHGTLELIAEKQSLAPGQTFYVGLHFQLEKGWHIYWINPGDSGEPPRVKWHLPAGITAGAIEWPTPHRLGTSTIVDFGYEDAVTLLVPFTSDAALPQAPALIAADVKVLVCREVCIPGAAQLSLTLPVKSLAPASDPHTVEYFTAARNSLPHPAPINWKMSVAESTDSFVLTANLGHPITQAVFLPLAESQIANSAQQKLLPSAAGFRLTLRKSDQLIKPLDHLKGVLVLSGGRGYIIDVPVGKIAAAKNFGHTAIRPVNSILEGLAQ